MKLKARCAEAMANPQRVLIIDDDEMSRDLLSLLIEAEGHIVHSAADGEAGLASISVGSPMDVVLTDLQMPGLSGAALAQKLRLVCGDAILLAMSATRPAKVPEDYDGFLLKPFDGPTFSAALQQKNAAMPATSVPASTAPLNEVVYAKLAASMKPESLRELYGICLSDARGRIENMRQLQAGGNEAGFRAEAHAIKGGCSMLGATRLTEIAAALETGRGGRDFADAALDEFLHQCEVLEGILLEKRG
jgi:CheY-like chemotaxis protein/HPt (histidine-containing phosphotransfer) domain-containing protein